VRREKKKNTTGTKQISGGAEIKKKGVKIKSGV